MPKTKKTTKKEVGSGEYAPQPSDVVTPERVTIPAPNFEYGIFHIQFTAPFVQCAFGAKSRQALKDIQLAGESRKKNIKREPKDFQALYEEAHHISDEGWCGVPASAFRNAAISACRVCGYAMTRAKLTIFAEADGFDRDSRDPLIKILKGKPHYHEAPVRVANGRFDLRPRPMWDPGMEMTVRIRYDADQFRFEDVANLMMRVGLQVGIGEGRPDSRETPGCGWGFFRIVSSEATS